MAKEVMDLLDYCAKVNANLLLNIGPRPDYRFWRRMYEY